jgi:cobalt/nickel transport system ATP-binding protein
MNGANQQAGNQLGGDVLLSFAGVSYRYAAMASGDLACGLSACSLEILRGSRNVLLGANGSGKTTLLQHCIGLLQPQSGHIEFAGEPLRYDRAGLSALRRRIGLVFQNPDRQLFSASVLEDVSFGPLNLGLDANTVRQRVAEALAAVGMADYAERPVHHLSFGQKKRVCIAGVLAMQPEVLLLDEPMAGLDAAMQAELLAVLEGLSARGITILLSTHDVDFAYQWADAIHLMAAGQCAASFAATALPQQTNALRAAGQPLPVVLGLQQALVVRGILPPESVPRSLEDLRVALMQP